MTPPAPRDDAAVDPQLVADAAELLSMLPRTPAAPERLRRALARLRARHPGCRVHLVADEESYDGSVHHALIVRRPDGLTLSLSAAGAGLPWPLRGVVRSREYDLLAVNGVRVPVLDALACVDRLFDDRHLLRTLVDSCLIGQALDEQPVDISPALLQETADAFRRAKQLHSAAATRAWLAERSLSEERFTQMIEHQARVRALRRRVAGDRVDEWFARHRDELALVSAAWVGLPVDGADAGALAASLVADPLGAIVTARRERRGGGIEEWRVEELAEGRRALAEAEIGAAASVDVGGPAVALVLDRRAAVLDRATREFVERRLFDEWLAERRRTAQVQWFWGNDARTAGAAAA